MTVSFSTVSKVMLRQSSEWSLLSFIALKNLTSRVASVISLTSCSSRSSGGLRIACISAWFSISSLSPPMRKICSSFASRILPSSSSGIEEVEVPRLCAAILPSRGAFEASGLTDQRRARGPAVLPTSFRMASSAALAAALSTAGWFASESEDIDMVVGCRDVGRAVGHRSKRRMAVQTPLASARALVTTETKTN